MERKNSKFSNVMAFIVVAVAFIVLALPGTKWKTVEVTPPPHDTVVVARLSREDTINAMALAFAQQESGFNHKAVSPCGQWVGCLQISEIMVREANRIVGFDCFNYNDRYDRQGSYAIFRIIQEHKNPKLEIDRAIDVWNPGCGSDYRGSVKKYFEYNLQNYNTLHNYYEI
jgi:hypothetical protein